MPPLWKPATNPAGSHSGLEASGSHSFHSPAGGITYRPLTWGWVPFTRSRWALFTLSKRAGSAGWLYFVTMIGTDLSGGGAAGLAGLFIAMPTAIAFLVVPKKVGIYNVPFKHRTQPPTDQPSGARGKTSGNFVSP